MRVIKSGSKMGYPQLPKTAEKVVVEETRRGQKADNL